MPALVTDAEYKGWANNTRVANREIELIVTRDVGPRIIRFGFIGEPNVLGEIDEEIGRSGEPEWKVRGGHRLWIAPEEKPKTYEPDNAPVEVADIPNGIRATAPVGSLSGIRRQMEIRMSPKGNSIRIVHHLTNAGTAPVRLAPWALTIMAKRGTAIIPLPAKISHTERLLHNQEWSLWGYTDLTDPRWTWGTRYIMFRQDPARGPNKIGIAHREGWVAYWLSGYLFVKKFQRVEGKEYPDGGVNFETFSNEAIMELESLGPLSRLKPGSSVKHEERWELHRNVPPCATEDDVDRNVRPLISV